MYVTDVAAWRSALQAGSPVHCREDVRAARWNRQREWSALLSHANGSRIAGPCVTGLRPSFAGSIRQKPRLRWGRRDGLHWHLGRDSLEPVFAEVAAAKEAGPRRPLAARGRVRDAWVHQRLREHRRSGPC